MSSRAKREKYRYDGSTASSAAVANAAPRPPRLPPRRRAAGAEAPEPAVAGDEEPEADEGDGDDEGEAQHDEVGDRHAPGTPDGLDADHDGGVLGPRVGGTGRDHGEHA